MAQVEFQDLPRAEKFSERDMMLVRLVKFAPSNQLEALLPLFLNQSAEARALCLFDDETMLLKVNAAVRILEAQGRLTPAPTGHELGSASPVLVTPTPAPAPATPAPPTPKAT
jgi:hypothetical protein